MESHWPLETAQFTAENSIITKLKRRLQKLVWVYTCQNATLLEITCCGSIILFWLSNVISVYYINWETHQILPLISTEISSGSSTGFKWYMHKAKCVSGYMKF